MFIGVIGVVLRRSALIVLFSIELILSAANINLVAFARLFGGPDGQFFAIFIAAIMAAELLVALAIFAVVFRRPLPLPEEKLPAGNKL